MRLAYELMRHVTAHMNTGTLTIRFPDLPDMVIDKDDGGPSAEIHIHRSRAVWRLLSGGDLGFASAYVDADWDSPDIEAVLRLALKNEAALAKALRPWPVWGWVAHLRHRLRPNTLGGSRKNIASHYDLGNRFYALWLDKSMTYSSALFERPDMSLHEAQMAKYARIVKRLNIGPDDHVLEIGCGWGGFAEYAIAATGCRITGLTLSTEQAAFARERLARAGMASRADIRLEDYRHVTGQFDKIVSIEMFEAVGEDNWPVYFRTVRARLKPGGQAHIQTITIADDRFAHYRVNADYIQTYIFPGGMLPSPATFIAAARKEELNLNKAIAFGQDYARTLRLWDNAFVAQWQHIHPLGFDERFYRMWRYYLHYCAAGFEADTINVYQFDLSAPES
ncbi:MAG: cyclopropane-fatty-acyl-phospholipid synthase family protein [Asticcacaulis sp.]